MKLKNVLIILFIVIIMIISFLIDKNFYKEEITQEETFTYSEEDLIAMDMFYTEEILEQVSRVDVIPLDYSDVNSKEDGYYTKALNTTYNQKLFDEFIQKYKKKKKAFLRYVLFTDEGDAIINDIFYDPKSESPIKVLIDYKRDHYSDAGVVYRTFNEILKNDDKWILVENSEDPTQGLVLGTTES